MRSIVMVMAVILLAGLCAACETADTVAPEIHEELPAGDPEEDQSNIQFPEDCDGLVIPY